MRLEKTLKAIFFILLALTVSFFGIIIVRELISKNKVSADTIDQRALTATPKKSSSDFKWGMGLNLLGLNILPAESLKDWTIAKPQIDMAKELGVEYVRIGIPDWGMVRQEELILPAVKYAHEKELGIVLGFDPVEGNPTKMGNKDRLEDGYKWGKEIATRYKGLVEYYQISNEVTGTVMKPSWPGVSEESYDEVKYKQVLDWLKGASQGIKEADPSAKRVITGHWLGFALFEMFIRDGLEFEVIGWDWYGKNPSITNVKNDNKIYNLANELSKFNKELWISETNYEAGSKEGEDKQAEYIKEFATKISSDKRFSGFFPLYLTDVAPIGKGENHDGFVSVEVLPDGSVQMGTKKQAYFEYEKIIKNGL